MGAYDLAAAVDYILNATDSEKLIYMGHSQGTTIFYVLLSTRPEYNKKILFHIGVAPVASLTHTTSAFRYFTPLAKQIEVKVVEVFKNNFISSSYLKNDNTPG